MLLEKNISFEEGHTLVSPFPPPPPPLSDETLAQQLDDQKQHAFT